MSRVAAPHLKPLPGTSEPANPSHGPVVVVLQARLEGIAHGPD